MIRPIVDSVALFPTNNHEHISKHFASITLPRKPCPWLLDFSVDEISGQMGWGEGNATVPFRDECGVGLSRDLSTEWKKARERKRDRESWGRNCISTKYWELAQHQRFPLPSLRLSRGSETNQGRPHGEVCRGFECFTSVLEGENFRGKKWNQLQLERVESESFQAVRARRG